MGAIYLEVYMKSKSGETYSHISGSGFYDSFNLTPSDRQIARDKEKAKNLSRNAVLGEFPGIY